MYSFKNAPSNYLDSNSSILYSYLFSLVMMETYISVFIEMLPVRSTSFIYSVHIDRI